MSQPAKLIAKLRLFSAQLGGMRLLFVAIAVFVLLPSGSSWARCGSSKRVLVYSSASNTEILAALTAQANPFDGSMVVGDGTHHGGDCKTCRSRNKGEQPNVPIAPAGDTNPRHVNLESAPLLEPIRRDLSDRLSILSYLLDGLTLGVLDRPPIDC